MSIYNKHDLFFVFTASKGSAHDGARWRWLGHSGAFPRATRPLSGACARPRRDSLWLSQQQPLERPQPARPVEQQQRLSQRRPPNGLATSRLHQLAGGAQWGLPSHPRQVPKPTTCSKLIMYFGSTALTSAHLINFFDFVSPFPTEGLGRQSQKLF